MSEISELKQLLEAFIEASGYEVEAKLNHDERVLVDYGTNIAQLVSLHSKDRMVISNSEGGYKIDADGNYATRLINPIIDYKITKKAKKTRAAKDNPYTPEFEQAWSLKPSRGPHNNDKAKAFSAWNARLNDTPRSNDLITASHMIEGIRCYAAYIKHENPDPRHVLQLSTFLGPSRHYLKQWEIVAKPEDKIKLPYLNEDLQAWATDHGLRMGKPSEGYPEYRKYLQGEVDRLNNN